jgi:hypothetical protein
LPHGNRSWAAYFIFLKHLGCPSLILAFLEFIEKKDNMSSCKTLCEFKRKIAKTDAVFVASLEGFLICQFFDFVKFSQITTLKGRGPM